MKNFIPLRDTHILKIERIEALEYLKKFTFENKKIPKNGSRIGTFENVGPK